MYGHSRTRFLLEDEQTKKTRQHAPNGKQMSNEKKEKKSHPAQFPWLIVRFVIGLGGPCGSDGAGVVGGAHDAFNRRGLNVVHVGGGDITIDVVASWSWHANGGGWRRGLLPGPASALAPEFAVVGVVLMPRADVENADQVTDKLVVVDEVIGLLQTRRRGVVNGEEPRLSHSERELYPSRSGQADLRLGTAFDAQVNDGRFT
ncbi:hypothetical protein BDN72DRAFT_593725 [Pluteus cervinus]|uniref:Uncharacterized protein n=1 Tax=Pluteus cervinus TaxID=181527 RepID=A0ACD3A1N2_9AGAR|nr:hypothetical protein BDN72DRAFT_593725 [Pluteus cervinus]